MSQKRYPNRLAEIRSLHNVKRFNYGLSPITQETLAKKCGVSRQTIVSIENHEQMPSYPLAIRLFAVFRGENIKLIDLFPIPPRDRSPDKTA